MKFPTQSTQEDSSGFRPANEAAKPQNPQMDTSALYQRGRLDLTVEAVVTESPRWRDLFTDEELSRAEKRLKAYGYQSRTA